MKDAPVEVTTEKRACQAKQMETAIGLSHVLCINNVQSELSEVGQNPMMRRTGAVLTNESRQQTRDKRRSSTWRTNKR